MDNTEQADVKLIVRDENSLYMPFSPDSEFGMFVKSYIRSKIAVTGKLKRISLTVLSENPLDEERFRSAVSNWIKDEKEELKAKSTNTFHTLIGSLIFGSVLFLLSMYLQPYHEELKYSLLPIMGSISLSKGAGILIMELPIMKANKVMLSELEQHNVITFKYGDDLS